MPVAGPLSFRARAPRRAGSWAWPGLVGPTCCFCWPRALLLSSGLALSNLPGGDGLVTGSPFWARVGRGAERSRLPLSAGPPAALAQGELQRGLHRLGAHQGAESVRGVRAQVGRRTAVQGGVAESGSSGATGLPSSLQAQGQDFRGPVNPPSAPRPRLPAALLCPFPASLRQVPPGLPLAPPSPTA